MFPRRLPLVVALSFAPVACLAATPASSPIAPTPWPHEQSDLVPDPRVTWGRLDNGLRFAILPHAQPAGRVSLCLLVQAGSYFETDDERGYAHFVEHMAFNGTRDFPGRSVVATLQQFGLSFGPHVNATTSFFETRYTLSNLAVANQANLAAGFRVLRNFGDGVLFDAREVKKERGVILSERRAGAGSLRANITWSDLEFAGDDFDTIRTDELDGLFDETRLENRYPIGTERGVNRASPQGLRAFYDRWYRPMRMILTVVGDLDPAAIETLVRENFVSLAARGAAATPPAVVAPPPPASPPPAIFARWRRHEPSYQVTIGSAVPAAGTDTAANRRVSLVRRLALEMLEDRIRQDRSLTAVESAALISHLVPGWDLPLLRLDTKAGEKTAAVVALDTELRRACELGFDDEEFQRSKSSVEWTFTDAVDAGQSRPASTLSVEMALAAARGVVWTSAADDSSLARKQLATVSPDECRDALRVLWPAQQTKVLLSGPAQASRAESEKLRAALLAARKQPVAALGRPAAMRPFPYTDFGPAGKVVARRHDAALDVWYVDFANGVRLDFKQTAFEPGRARIAMNFGYGILGAPADRPGLVCAVYALVFGGLRNVTREESDAEGGLSGLSGSATLASDRFVLSGEGPARGVRSFLRFSAAHFVAPAFDEARRKEFVAIAQQVFAASKVTAAGVAGEARRRLLFSGHPAMRTPTIEDVMRFSFDDFRAWLEPQLASSPLDVVIVGDLAAEEAIEWVSHTFGAMAPRPSGDPVAALRELGAPAGPRREVVKFAGGRAIAIAGLGWTQPDRPGRRDDLCVQLLAGILQSRLENRVREDMGETYAPRTFSGDASFLTPPLLMLACEVDVAPRRVDRVAKAVRKVVEELARDGVNPDELERIRNPAVRASEDRLRSNAWWLAQLADARARPDSVAELANLPRAYESITAAELTDLVREAFTLERAREWIIVPK